MRALTLTQPWAGLVASGIKLVENRPLPLIKRENFGEPFAIHASREIDDNVYDQIFALAPELVGDLNAPWYTLSRITSAVIGVATVVAVEDIRALREDARRLAIMSPSVSSLPLLSVPKEQRRWFFGPVGYVLRDVHAIWNNPIRCRGWQGFWTLPDHIAETVAAQIGRAA